MTDYAPSQQLADAVAVYEKAQLAAIEARDRLRAAVASEMLTFDVTGDAVAEHLPWSGETVRGIAREFGIPHKRKPTVRSIKPQRRKSGGSTSD
jgi:hypothetical protein